MFLVFLLLSFFCFTLPGILALAKTENLTLGEQLTFGSVIGFIFFTTFAYLLLVIGFPFLLIPSILLISTISLRELLRKRINLKLSSKKEFLLFSIVIILGIIGQLAVIAPSGTNKNGDLIFYSSNGHDGPWHMALMEEIKKGFPLQNPVFAQKKLVNYHFFSDIAPAFFNKYFQISQVNLYFRYFPFLYSILLGMTSYQLGKRLGGNFMAGIWSLFFTLFAGSFGYIVTWIREKQIGGEGIFWATQVQSSTGNPPQIVSDFIILSILFLIFVYLKKKNWIIFFCLILLISSLAVFKIYASVVVLLSFGLIGFWQLISRRDISILLIGLISSLLSSLLYFPNSTGSTGFLIFEPWWYIRTMIVVPDRLNWIDLEHKRQTYIFENNWKRVVQLEATGFLIFFFGNLGMRFLGLFYFMKIFKKPFQDYLNQIIFIMIVISLVMPLLFLQKGVASNTSQFLQYFLLLMGIIAGLIVSKLLNLIKTNILRNILILLIILLSIPTQLGLIYSFYSKSPLAKITSSELDALTYLKNKSNPDAVILTPPFNKDYKENGIPNIWAWSDSAYVAAFSGRRTYLADTEQVDIMGYDLKTRLTIQQTIFTENDPVKFSQLLKENQINYLYYPKALKPVVELDKTNFKKIFSNSLVEIWQI